MKVGAGVISVVSKTTNPAGGLIAAVSMEKTPDARDSKL